MPRVLFCPLCDAPTAVTVEKPKTCATCGAPVEWRELESVPYTLSYNDRAFLRQLRIAPS